MTSGNDVSRSGNATEYSNTRSSRVLLPKNVEIVFVRIPEKVFDTRTFSEMYVFSSERRKKTVRRIFMFSLYHIIGKP